MGRKEEGTGCCYIVIRLYWLVIHKVGGREGRREEGREGGKEGKTGRVRKKAQSNKEG